MNTHYAALLRNDGAIKQLGSGPEAFCKKLAGGHKDGMVLNHMSVLPLCEDGQLLLVPAPAALRTERNR